MNGTVLIELTHEEHYKLMEVLRVSKAYDGSDATVRILNARSLLHLPSENRWKFHDWTPEEEKKEREDEARRNAEFYNMVREANK